KTLVNLKRSHACLVPGCDIRHSLNSELITDALSSCKGPFSFLLPCIHILAMTRKRKSTAKAIEIGNKGKQIQQIQVMGPFISDLPKSVLQDVLIKLPIRSIIMCKTVCKAWYSLISDHEFAKLHLAQAEACPLVRPSAPTRVSRTDYVGDAGTSDCIHFHLRMNFAKFKIPLRNADQAIHAMRNRKGRTKRKPGIKLEPLDHKYMYVNSCNGLLFLAETFYNDPLVVCNPITGEFVQLPEASKDESRERLSIRCALGYSPKTNQYKVLRVFSQGTPNLVRMVELYTLGQSSWKSLGTAPTSAAYMLLTLPTYLNGELYWFYYESSYEIASFDFDNEQFHSVPTPPFELEECQHLRGFSPYFEAISHVPSFISLKDILMGNDVEVLNINSRCAECKLPGETRGLDLVNLDADVASDDPLEYTPNKIGKMEESVWIRKAAELFELIRLLALETGRQIPELVMRKQKITFCLAGCRHLNAMPKFIQIMMNL
ncbi:F-box and associated interaction domains-containing protein, partial [Prunus dulcis]